MQKFLDSKVLRGVLYGIGTMLALLVVFSAGVSVGTRRASYGLAWQKNYDRNFGMGIGRESGKMLFLNERLPGAHGAVGPIIRKELPEIIVSDKDAIEKTVLVGENTAIHRMRESIKADDLSVDDFVVVIGSPNETGQIEAKLIRVMPEPGMMIRK